MGMIDREKVINSLTDIENIMIARQEICSREELQYWIELQEGVADALALLKEQEVGMIDRDKFLTNFEAWWKEQEAVKPKWFIDAHNPAGAFRCGSCGERIVEKDFDFYCSKCGKPILWEGQ